MVMPVVNSLWFFVVLFLQGRRQWQGWSVTLLCLFLLLCLLINPCDEEQRTVLASPFEFGSGFLLCVWLAFSWFFLYFSGFFLPCFCLRSLFFSPFFALFFSFDFFPLFLLWFLGLFFAVLVLYFFGLIYAPCFRFSAPFYRDPTDCF